MRTIVRVISVLAIALMTAGAVVAQDNPVLQTGFAADKLYDFHGIDSVNTFNGNLTISIPLGGRYPVNSHFSYGLTLTYNSKVWSYVEATNSCSGGSNCPPLYTRAEPNHRSNAGLGWLVSMGRMVPPEDPLSTDANGGYQTADGATHAFYGELHPQGSEPLGDPASGLFSRDNSYFRATPAGDGTQVRHPDGTTYTFASDGALAAISDAYGDSVYVRTITGSDLATITACTAAPSFHLTSAWEITDSTVRDVANPSQQRKQYVCFTDTPAYPENIYGNQLVKRIVLQAPQGQAGVYEFHYVIPAEPAAGDQLGIHRGCHSGGLNDDPYPNVPLLYMLDLPDGSHFSAAYNLTAGEQCQQGTIQSLTLPTGGRLEYDYRYYQVPNQKCSISHGWMSYSTGVGTRRLVDGDRSDVWTYTTEYAPRPDGSHVCDDEANTFLNFPNPSEAFATVLTAPDGVVRKDWYSVWPFSDASPHGYDVREFSLPLKRDESSGGAFLSTETFSAGGSPLRSTFLKFDYDAAVCYGLGETEGLHSSCFDSNRRVSHERTIYHDDGNRVTDTAYSDFDGFGHYRVAARTDTFGSATRSSRTNFNPGTDARGRRAGVFAFQATDPWVLNTFDTQTATQGAQSARTEACFDGAGLLTRQRTLRQYANADGSFARSSNDLLAVYQRNSIGDIEEEKYYGGDCLQGGSCEQALSADALCDLSLPAAPTYHLLHTYKYGVRATSNYQGPGGLSLSALDRTVDPTGAITCEKDAAGASTCFTYNSMWRLKSVTPPVGAVATYTYSNATDTVRAEASAARSDTLTTFQFDGFGRLWREKRRMPDSSTSISETHYDAEGRTDSTSELQKLQGAESQFVPSFKTSFTFDEFGRPRTVTSPDQSVMSFASTGVRLKQRSSNVWNGSVQLPSTVWEEYDGSGRLIKVTETPLLGTTTDTTHNVVTSYGYDVGDRLTAVSMAAADGGAQSRAFHYDAAGLLISEQHPELGADGNGTISYGKYDARGHNLFRQTGPATANNDLTFVYDFAERLAAVARHDGTNLKTFVYGSAGNSKGRLIEATRYNELTPPALNATETPAAIAIPVTEKYEYNSGGEITTRTTTIGSEASPLQKFAQSFTYTSLGALSTVAYPTCVAGPCSGSPSIGTIANTYLAGAMNGVTGYASFAYHQNAAIASITHLSSNGGGAPGIDVHAPDPHGMTRPESIAFTNYCVGPPVPASEPADAVAVKDAPATLQITPLTGGTYQYQWFRGASGNTGGPVTGATNASYTTPPLVVAASYWVRVTDVGNCSTDSRTATVTVEPCGGVHIQTPPVSSIVPAGTAANLSIAATAPTGIGLTYAWYQGEAGDRTTRIATEASTTVTAAAGTKSYWVEVTASPTCSIASSTVTVTGCSAPAITVQPVSRSAMLPKGTETIKLTTSVTATGEKLTYTWFWRGADQVVHSKQGGAFFELEMTSASSEQTDVWVQVATSGVLPSSCTGTVQSNVATFTLVNCNKLLAISATSGTQHIYDGMNRLIELQATSSIAAGATVTYQWKHGFTETGVDLAAGPNVVLGVPSYDVAWCDVKVSAEGSVCEVNTKKAYISLFGTCPLPPVSITPSSVDTTPGAPIEITAVCDWPTVLYQWYRGASGDTRYPMPGETGKTLHVNATAENYWCRVADECGIAHHDTAAVPVVTALGNEICAPFIMRRMPQSLSVAAGESVTLFVDVANFWGYTAEWHEVGSSVVVGTGSSLTVIADHTRSYYVQLTAACGVTMTTIPAIVQVVRCGEMVITQQPAPHTWTTSGTPLNLAVAAAGGTVTSHQWFEGAVGDTTHPVSGGTLSTVTVSTDHSTQYWVRLAADSCAIDSNAAVVEVCAIPTVVTSPSGDSIRRGGGVVLGVNGDSGALSYTWRYGTPQNPGPDIIGTQRYLYVRPLSTTSYFATLSGPCGDYSGNDTAATVTVCTPATITQQPADVKIFSGETTTLTVAAENEQSITVPLIYKWYDSVGQLVGEGSSFQTPPATTDKTYTAIVYGGICETQSRSVTVSICALAAVVGGGGPFFATANDEVLIRSGANTAPQTQFTWYRGESGDVAHSTQFSGPSFADETPVYPSQTTHYWAQVEYGGCVSRTPTIEVRICKPAVTTQPLGVKINSGAHTTLSVAASGSPLTYQWYAGGTGDTTAPVANGTGATVDVHPTVTAQYWVRVTGACSTAGDFVADSAAATVTVCAPPVISPAPAGSSIVRGQDAILNVTASGTGLSYAWYNSAVGVLGTPIATTATKVVTPQGTTTYWVRVTDTCGNYVDSGAVTVTVCTLATISQQPASQTIFNGASTTLTVAATAGTGAPALTYQWYTGNSGDTTAAINGATSTTLNTGALTASRNYWVRVTSGACITDSNTATISMCALTQTVAGAPNMNSAVNQSVRLQLPNYGVTGLTYNWYQGASGNTSSLIAQNQAANYLDRTVSATTQYWAQVVNGSCVSNTGTTTINVCVPTITTQPASTNVTAGNSASLSVASTPAGNTYQWYAGASGVTTSPVSPGNTASISVQPSATTSYWCRVTGSCGVSTNSNAATVTVCTPMSVTQLSASGSISQGQSYTLNVLSSGTGVTYYWYRGAQWDVSSPVGPGATVSQTPSVTTTYHARVTDTCGNIIVTPLVTVTVCTTPVITQQPVSQSVMSGSSRQLTVVATTGTGAPAATYQWYLGTSGNTASPAPNGTSATLDTGAVTSDRSYWVRVTSGACSVDSATAVISLCPLGQTVAGGPTLTEIQPGDSVTLQLPAYPATGLTYKWYQGASGDKTSLIAGPQSANSLLRTPSVTTQYWAEVISGSCVSNTTTMTISPCKPKITSQPAGASINSGSSVHIAIAASPSGITYQWYTGTSGSTTAPMAGKTGTFIDVVPTVTTSYWCRVTGTCAANVQDSVTAVVTVCQLPAITQQPASRIASPNVATTMPMTASGTSVTYQWYRGASGDTSSPVNGQTSATLTVSAAVTERYWVRVQNACGSVNSNSAWMSIYPTILSQSGDVYLNSGSHVNASLSASGAYLSYQWYRDTTSNQVGTNSATLISAPVTTGTSFFAYVTSGIAQTSSQAVTAHICTGPSVSTPAVYQTWQGKELYASVGDGNNICRYEWYRGPSGDTSQLVQPSIYSNGNDVIVNPTAPTEYWLRVVGLDPYNGDPNNNGDCYTDSAAVTVNP
jgi:hypothetical protein